MIARALHTPSLQQEGATSVDDAAALPVITLELVLMATGGKTASGASGVRIHERHSLYISGL
jgi:hypothetical protein